MGIEYKIGCEPSAVAALDTFLRQTRFYEDFDEAYGLYNLRLSGPEKAWNGPDVHIRLETDGVYFLDNLSSPAGEADRILRALIDELLLRSQAVTITEP